MRRLHFLVFLTFTCTSVAGIHPKCNFLLELQREEEDCHARLNAAGPPAPAGCPGLWDNISCWHHAEVGETITIPCPQVLRSLFGRNGNISKNCTAEGWSDVFPAVASVCGSEERPDKLMFYTVVKTLYTLGHSLSLIALTTGSAILCLFRKLHCTRNFIHLNLFFSFILRAVAVLVKDGVLFSYSSDCSGKLSVIGCRACLVFCHYFIMVNFFWLLVEGLYLHTLLVTMFLENKRFIIYLLIGWGFPTVFVLAWITARIYLEDTGCWEMNEIAVPNWVINGPIMVSIMVNFVIFISIIRILVQKLICPVVGGKDQSQYRRLAKSTLLLIPLFGVHYVLFMSLNESMADYKIFLELGIGSFQGLVVAILYCFLNSEVQGELRRKWESMSLSCRPVQDYSFHNYCVSQNGPDNVQQNQRHSRAPSVLQTESTDL
ncbi:vasoactive intestinal polypeptide receptor 2 [Paramormyrops kingsleyae]|uniref:Vasoactive intestinal peptide receptor 2 n=1 Tax=Paramormyrops kingsleyae TaxID=1676925 RepID=A0A3B3SQ64_9TELE|nr:vasoactive intestinal polypeptide receptor 2 isoform X2 [Paramormyrops kingsleyae]